MAELDVSVVAAEHSVYEGRAQRVVAKTPEGEIGILPRHEPVLATLVEGRVKILTVDGQTITALADGGFLSAENNRVTIVADQAELAS